jgi:hypothetical protein
MSSEENQQVAMNRRKQLPHTIHFFAPNFLSFFHNCRDSDVTVAEVLVPISRTLPWIEHFYSIL